MGLPWGGWEVRLRSSKFSFAEEKKHFFWRRSHWRHGMRGGVEPKKYLEPLREREREIFSSLLFVSFLLLVLVFSRVIFFASVAVNYVLKI